MTPKDLPRAYVPADNEPNVRERWGTSGWFHVEPPPEGRPTFSVVLPPPNVTAALHLGHALNATLQDVLVRYHRMRGDVTLWLPGTDHAGIATQAVVERRLQAEGKTRHDLGRDAFIARVQKWKDDYERVILEQLAAVGASFDVERVRFTMDEVCAPAVQHAFFVLFRDGLVYRGQRLVNWDPVAQTALADDEVEAREMSGHMWYLRYPLADGSGHVTVATTRPETMLGDTAVAVNPADPRAAELVGRSVRLPIVERDIPIIADDFVVLPDPNSSDPKAQFSSGFLKVTPAHDPNDWEIAQRHGLAVVTVLGPDATISDQFGWSEVSDEARGFLGLSREDARAAIVAWFDQSGLLEDVRPYVHTVGHSYRSHVPIEPRLSDQWYVRVTDDRLRGSAMRALDDGVLRFVPHRYANSYSAWLDSLRDWCVSRQLWWGHQIPVWTRVVDMARAPAESTDVEPDVMVGLTSRWTQAGAAHAARRVTSDRVEEAVCVPPQATLRRMNRPDESMDEQALVAALEVEGFVRDPDVLDTWFSSGLWPMATMGWPWPEDHPETVGLLESFNPTSVLVTAREIITLWVSRMVMFNRYFLEDSVPFRDVFIHAMIQDGYGQKMSKSLGNGVDPRDIIATHGTDALRYTLVELTTDQQDVRLPVDMIDPYTGETFEPETIRTAAGHVVAAPVQSSPTDQSRRMVSAYGVASGQAQPADDMPLAVNTSKRFDQGRNFANKLWNVTRFALMRSGDAVVIDGDSIDLASRPAPDRWIVSRFVQIVGRLEAHLERYEFSALADALYSFVWTDVCDRYVEMAKPTLGGDPDQQAVLLNVIDGVLRIMHPVMPFVTETLWPSVTSLRKRPIDGIALGESELLALAPWPKIDHSMVDHEVLSLFDRALALVAEINSQRGRARIEPNQRLTLYAERHVIDLIGAVDGVVQALARVEAVVDLAAERPDRAWPTTFEGHEVLLATAEARIDPEQERRRLERQIERQIEVVIRLTRELDSPDFLLRAPTHVVERRRQDLARAEAELEALRRAIAALG